jgi:hypothetical protein
VGLSFARNTLPAARVFLEAPTHSTDAVQGAAEFAPSSRRGSRLWRRSVQKIESALTGTRTHRVVCLCDLPSRPKCREVEKPRHGLPQAPGGVFVYRIGNPHPLPLSLSICHDHQRRTPPRSCAAGGSRSCAPAPHHLGAIEAPDQKTAEAFAVKTFKLTEEQRKRLSIWERDRGPA